MDNCPGPHYFRGFNFQHLDFQQNVLHFGSGRWPQKCWLLWATHFLWKALDWKVDTPDHRIMISKSYMFTHHILNTWMHCSADLHTHTHKPYHISKFLTKLFRQVLSPACFFWNCIQGLHALFLFFFKLSSYILIYKHYNCLRFLCFTFCINISFYPNLH